MNSRLSKIIKHNRPLISLRQTRGQMAIFVALIFQVLFLFFAMVINVGLVVHDKINLQNAVDLSAYYFAQKQAETLNVMAHTNYQIRQAWKLLNWRYYVLGTMGLRGDQASPASAGYQGDRSETPFTGAIFPTMCVSYSPTWQGNLIGANDSVCKSHNFMAPNIRVPQVIAPFLPINRIFNQAAAQLQREIARSCDGYAGINWWFAANTYLAYVQDQSQRKQVIRALARNLAQKPEDMVDISGDSVYVGAQKTFVKNLTRTNAETIEEFKVFNSMEGLRPEHWLKEVDVYFSLIYSDVVGTAESCSTNKKHVFEPPSSTSWRGNLANVFGEENIAALIQYLQFAEAPPAGDSRRTSLGVEKNPWYLVYAGVKAKTKPRAIFSPFGSPVQLEARAYASPFGGRMGPWYGRYWAQGANESAGSPLQLSPVRTVAGQEVDISDVRRLLPALSRFPGDQLGYSSKLAQAAFAQQGLLKARHSDYANILGEMGPNATNDMLPFSDRNDTNVRDYEIAAISPDLLDVTYYSIEPNFGQVYLPRLRQNQEKLGIPSSAYPRGDLGARDPDNAAFSVKDQMRSTLEPTQTRPGLIESDVFWAIKDRAHLLTGWVHNDTLGDYTQFPAQRFGRCVEADDKYKTKVPGTCLHLGGRTGYSVKIISGDYLREDIPLGGSGQGPGKILNPPAW